MLPSPNNYAFIDSQNLHYGLKRLGLALDYRRFRVYLKDKYRVSKAYMFIGFIPRNEKIYSFLQEAGYILIFKPVLETKDREVKGNCDAELVLHTMIQYANYDRAVIVSGDGDFYCLVDYLREHNKMAKVIAVSNNDCSSLLRKAAGSEISFVCDLKHKMEYKKTPHKDETL